MEDLRESRGRPLNYPASAPEPNVSIPYLIFKRMSFNETLQRETLGFKQNSEITSSIRDQVHSTFLNYD